MLEDRGRLGKFRSPDGIARGGGGDVWRVVVVVMVVLVLEGCVVVVLEGCIVVVLLVLVRR